MDIEQYFEMCEQMGWEPDDERIPIDPSSLSITAQQALILLRSLPDMWEGMSGSWLGKDYSGLTAIMGIYGMEDRRNIFELYKEAERELGEHYAQKQKEQTARSKRAK